MKTIVVTDALAAELVAKNEAEYLSGDEHVVAALPEAITKALPPVKTMAVNGMRADLPCPQGTPDTVTLTQTGHTLSLPMPQKGEMFAGYCGRIAQQAHGDASAVGALFLGVEPYFARFGGFKADGSNWPQAADAFYNPTAYMTDAERAAVGKSQQDFAQVMHHVAEQQSAAVVPHPEVQPVQTTPMPERSEPQELSPVQQPVIETQVVQPADVGGVEQILQPSQQ